MKRNTLTTAVVAGLTGMAGMVSVSNAVNVNPDGLGQVLLYPYYSARGGNDTLISIVNTTERGKAVKIRFIEALNSREVLDFNIYMSPFDAWTAVVSADGEGAKMMTTDTTCTVPYFVGNSTNGVGEQSFLDFEFAGDANDGGPAGIERTASGYIEVIEMGTMVDRDADDIGFWVEENTKHSAGVPEDCDSLVEAWTVNSTDATYGERWIDDPSEGFTSPSGGLYGAASIINVADGTMFSYNATAIDGFFTAGSEDSHTNPGNLFPDLTDGTGTTSYVFNNGDLLTHDWSAPLLAVNAAITHDAIINEYVTDSDIGARTEWVMTFPTKKFHVDVQTQGLTPFEPIPPFTTTWHTAAGGDTSLSCEKMVFDYYDREERPDPVPPGPGPGPQPPIVSPAPPPVDGPGPTPPTFFQLCREANVIRFSDTTSTIPAVSEILKEPSRATTAQFLGFLNIGLPFSEGWVKMDLKNVDPNTPGFGSTIPKVRQSVNSTGNGQMINGLPVVGFAVTSYTNGNLGAGVLANYGGTFSHRATRSVSAAISLP